MDFKLTVVTLGVASVADSTHFYESLGLRRRLRATGTDIAFFAAGGIVLALYPWDMLADDAALPHAPRPEAFRGTTLACNCATDEEVDVMLERAISAGATLVKAAQPTSYGGYSGYFSDPDGHAWEVVRAPGFAFDARGALVLPD